MELHSHPASEPISTVAPLIENEVPLAGREIFVENIIIMLLSGLLLFSFWIPLAAVDMDVIEDCVYDESECSYQLMNATTGERSCDSKDAWAFTQERTLRFWDQCQDQISNIDRLQLTMYIMVAMPLTLPLLLLIARDRSMALWSFASFHICAILPVMAVDGMIMVAKGECRIANNHPLVFGYRLALMLESILLFFAGVSSLRWRKNKWTTWLQCFIFFGPPIFLYSLVGVCFHVLPLEQGTDCNQGAIHDVR